MAKNPYETALLLGGTIAIAGGGILAGIAARQADSDRFTDELFVSMGGYPDPTAGAAATAWMWFGIGLAVLGAVALLAVLVIRAARHPNQGG